MFGDLGGGRRRLTISLAVASISPSGLSCTAFTADVCAGMMLTLPVAISTSCTCPVVRPGKAMRLGDKQHSPQGLLAVS